MSKCLRLLLILMLGSLTTLQGCDPSSPTGQPDLEGWVRISIQGPGASSDGFANAFENLPGSLDAMARGIESLMTLAKGLADPASLAKLDTARMQDLVNLAGGPGKGVAGDLRYDGLVTFKLEPRDDGLFRLKEGTVRYALRNGMSQSYRHGDDVVSLSLDVTDSIAARGEVPLDPKRDQITLRMNVGGHDSQWDRFVPTYELTLVIDHLMELYGQTSAHFTLTTPMGRSIQRWDTDFGERSVTHHLVMMAPPVLNQDDTWDAEEGESRQSLVYRQRGELPRDEVARFSETGLLSFGGEDVWRNNLGGSEVGSFGIGLPGPELNLECGPQWPELDEAEASRLRARLSAQLTVVPVGAAEAHRLARELLSGSTFCDERPSELFNQEKRRVYTLVVLESDLKKGEAAYRALVKKLKAAPNSRAKIRDLLEAEGFGQLLGISDGEEEGEAIAAARETLVTIGEREVGTAGIKPALAIAAEAQLLGVDDLSDSAVSRARTVAVKEFTAFKAAFDPCKAHRDAVEHLTRLLATATLLGEEVDRAGAILLAVEAADNLRGQTPPRCRQELPDDVKPVKIGPPAAG